MDLLINFVPIYEVFKPKERSTFVICRTLLGLILCSLISITLSNLSYKINLIILKLCKVFKIVKCAELEHKCAYFEQLQKLKKENI